MKNEEEIVRNFLLENECDEEVKFFTNFSYYTAIVGITTDGLHLVYDYDKMIEYLTDTQGFTTEEAIDWINYNTLSTIDYSNNSFSPLVVKRFYDNIESKED